MDKVSTYEQGLEISKTYKVYNDDKNQHIKYLRDLALENNAEVFAGIADGLEQRYIEKGTI